MMEPMRNRNEAQDSKTIRYYRKNVYGNDLLYPVDYPLEIESLTGKKTVDQKDIRNFEKLGFKFEEVLMSSLKKEGTR